jgi:hypothetical protein
LDWIEELVKEGKALDLDGQGYPCEFTAMATHLKTPILSGPPCVARWTLSELWRWPSFRDERAEWRILNRAM